MSEPVFRALPAQRERTRDDAFVFCNPQGNPLDYNNVSSPDIAPVRFHSRASC